MKKTVFAAMAVLILGSVGFASGVRETVTVEGVLAVKDSLPVIESGKSTSILPSGPFYRVAWENGIKVGDKVKVEGSTKDVRENCPIEGAQILMPAKVWVNGKEIDLSSFADKKGQKQGAMQKQRHGASGASGVHMQGRGPGAAGSSGNASGRAVRNRR